MRHSFGIDFRIGIPTVEGTVLSSEKALFEALANNSGLQPPDDGRLLETAGKVFRISAINPNRPNYPISAGYVADMTRNAASDEPTDHQGEFFLEIEPVLPDR